MSSAWQQKLNNIWKLPLAALILNNVVYFGSQWINAGWPHYDLSTSADRLIPLVPWTTGIYFGSYIFWVTNYILCARQCHKQAYRFYCADLIAKLVCLLCFLLLPTFIQRTAIVGDGIGEVLLRFLYFKDSPVNLFPSVHCLNSWLCYIGVRNHKLLPSWYRHLSCLIALAIFVSTLTTKQHQLIDVAAGIALAEFSYWIAAKRSLLEAYASSMRVEL